MIDPEITTLVLHTATSAVHLARGGPSDRLAQAVGDLVLVAADVLAEGCKDRRDHRAAMTHLWIILDAMTRTREALADAPWMGVH